MGGINDKLIVNVLNTNISSIMTSISIATTIGILMIVALVLFQSVCCDCLAEPSMLCDYSGNSDIYLLKAAGTVTCASYLGVKGPFQWAFLTS